MHQPIEKCSTCLLLVPETSTDLAHLGPYSDWWKRASSAQAVTTPRYWSEGTLGPELVQMCRPAAYSTKVIFVLADGDVADVAAGWELPAATLSGMASKLMPASWVANELELDIVSVLSTAIRRRLADLLPPGQDEAVGVEQDTPSQTNVDEAEEVRLMLAVTWSQMESITGISEQTFYDWKRNKRTARPSTLRKLKRLLALVRAVTRQRGVDAASEWFQAGAPSPVELMISGQMEAVEAQVGMMLSSALAAGSSSVEVIGAEAEHTPLAGQSSARRPKAATRPHRSSRAPDRDR